MGASEPPRGHSREEEDFRGGVRLLGCFKPSGDAQRGVAALDELLLFEAQALQRAHGLIVTGVPPTVNGAEMPTSSGERPFEGRAE